MPPITTEFPTTADPITPAKIDLGRILFFDTRLSKSQTIFCNSCHPLRSYGVHGKRVSAGQEGKESSRNCPTVYNAAAHFVQFWDGRATDVEEQAKGPVLNPVEMAKRRDRGRRCPCLLKVGMDRSEAVSTASEVPGSRCVISISR